MRIASSRAQRLWPIRSGRAHTPSFVPRRALPSIESRGPTAKARRYVDIRGVSANLTRRVPSPRSFSSIGGVFDTAVIPSGTTRDTSKVALAPGSSQQGKARRASVDSNWVAAIALLPIGHRVPASIEAREFVVERAGEREPQGRGTRGDGLGEVQLQHLALRSEVDRGRGTTPALRGADGGLADLESFRVQRDRLRRPRDLNPNRLAPVEREGFEVRSQFNRILLGSHGVGQSVFRGHDAPFPSRSPGRPTSNI